MKKILKITFYVLLSFLTILILFIYIYTQVVKYNLKTFEIDVKNKWSEYFLYSTDNVNHAKEFINNHANFIPNRNEINLIIERNLRERNTYRNECNLVFVELEYKLNQELLILLDSTNVNSTKFDSFKESFIVSSAKLNALIENYNNTTLSYNKYIAIFPNFIIAKRNGFNRKKFFEIKYGVYNVDPIIKSKELPEWAKGVDTTQ